MIDRAQWQRWLNNPIVDWSVFVLGVALILFSPVVGAIPGPGGIFVFALGLAMVLRTSRWARRRYVEFKRWQPKAGRWTDWGLRRGSAKRRNAIVKQQQQQPIVDEAPNPAIAPDAPIASGAPKTAAQLAREMDMRLQSGRPGN